MYVQKKSYVHHIHCTHARTHSQLARRHADQERNVFFSNHPRQREHHSAEPLHRRQLASHLRRITGRRSRPRARRRRPGLLRRTRGPRREAARHIRIKDLAERREGDAAVHIPEAAGEGRAGGRREGGGVCGFLDAGRGQGFPVVAEVFEVRADGGGGAAAGEAVDDVGAGVGGGGLGAVGDEAVVVDFLDPFVDDGAGPAGRWG